MNNEDSKVLDRRVYVQLKYLTNKYIGKYIASHENSYGTKKCDHKKKA